MKEIIEWLREIERLACEMYEKAASVYANDNVLKKFLENNAGDGAWHFHVMGTAALFLASEPDYVAAISVDKEINEKILNKISAINRTLEPKALARNHLIDQIVDFEVSEWNDIFLYAITFLKEKSSKFEYPAARIQNHLREIEFFLSSVEQKTEALLEEIS